MTARRKALRCECNRKDRRRYEVELGYHGFMKSRTVLGNSPTLLLDVGDGDGQQTRLVTVGKEPWVPRFIR
jgi:hypothetical protein